MTVYAPPNHTYIDTKYVTNVVSCVLLINLANNATIDNAKAHNVSFMSPLSILFPFVNSRLINGRLTTAKTNFEFIPGNADNSNGK